MRRSDITVMPEYFDRYIQLVDDVPITEALELNGLALLNPHIPKLKEIGKKVYAENKWTVNDILQHIIDSERIFTYRALRFARNDKTILPGFDENEYADVANADNRQLEDLILEFDHVRASTIDMFKSFSEEQLMKTGISFNKEISVLALGFTLAGHLIHHLNVIKERYYPII